ncbi:ComF family protein [bacterium]|nr:ComF family protein [candidate division CSSED10-310 bacterium]
MSIDRAAGDSNERSSHPPASVHGAGQSPARELGTTARQFKEAFLDIVFPRSCAVCGERDPQRLKGHICHDCRAELQRLTRPWCTICGMEFGADFEPSDLPRCGRCIQETFSFHHARSVYRYEPEGVISELILGFKHGGRVELAADLGDLMAAALPDCYPSVAWEGLVPVPLHRRRLHSRGYNQSFLLTTALARRLCLPVITAQLIRVKSTPPQKGSRKQRRDNVAGAFRVRDPHSFAGKNLLLIDDVMTTGATIDRCAAVLCRAGAARVDVYTLARVPFL